MKFLILIKMIFIFFLMLMFFNCTGQEKKDVFRYKNHIKSGIEGGIRDAQIFEDKGKYYLIGTAPPFWEGPNPGVRIFSSDNILDWEYEKLLIDRDKLDPSVWYYDRFWAPELHKIQGKYYLLFNARNESKEYQHWHGCGVAVSDHILGPYTVLTHNEPLTQGNDLSFFEDEDGRVYAYWNGKRVINGSELDMDKMKIQKTTTLFRCENGSWDSIGIEGPYVIKRKGVYYMFYSSWSRGYEIGYAVAEKPLGPWTKYQGNPIYGAQNVESCKKNGLPFTGDPNLPFRAVGHNEIFTGPDGRYWISCHAIEYGEDPYLCIDPIWFEDGVIKTNGPTYTTQEVSIK